MREQERFIPKERADELWKQVKMPRPVLKPMSFMEKVRFALSEIYEYSHPKDEEVIEEVRNEKI